MAEFKSLIWAFEGGFTFKDTTDKGADKRLSPPALPPPLPPTNTTGAVAPGDDDDDDDVVEEIVDAGAELDWAASLLARGMTDACLVSPSGPVCLRLLLGRALNPGRD